MPTNTRRDPADPTGARRESGEPGRYETDSALSPPPAPASSPPLDTCTRQHPRALDAEEREALAARAARGDHGAFNRLATCYRPALLLHLSRRVEDPHRAEDLVQDTLLRAWQTRGTYVAGKESSWIKWCKRIADRLLIDLWRRERLLDILLLADVCADASCRDAQDVVEWHVRAKSPSPEEQVLVAEQLDAAQRAIRRLPLPQQTALTLRTEGYGLDEIAAILCLPRGTVKVYIYRARSALRGMFARMTALRSE